MSFDIADVEFVNTDTNTIKAAVINEYESLAGRTLAAGDPIRLFLESIAFVIAQQDAVINYTGKMNLLKYATGAYLDQLGVLVGCTRLTASKAKTTVLITLSAAQNFSVLIPSGTRISAGEDVFFAMTENTIIAAGELTANVIAECTVAGSVGNNYVVGQLKTIVDPIAYVASMVNISESTGGDDVEDDESYRERIRNAPESYSCAGPEGAYEYYAKTASALIIDVDVSSPAAGKVNVVPLLEGGKLPGTEMLEAVKTVVNAEKVRPLTDEVTVKAPTPVNYNVKASYYISGDDMANTAVIQTKVNSAVDGYLLWQRSKLGRDINPSELITRVVNAGAKRVTVTEPVFKILDTAEIAQEGTVAVTFGGVDVD